MCWAGLGSRSVVDSSATQRRRPALRRKRATAATGQERTDSADRRASRNRSFQLSSRRRRVSCFCAAKVRSGEASSASLANVQAWHHSSAGTHV